MSWFRPKEKPLAIPIYRPAPKAEPKVEAAPGRIEVEEIDTSDMTSTGVHRIIRKWKGEGESS